MYVGRMLRLAEPVKLVGPLNYPARPINVTVRNTLDQPAITLSICPRPHGLQGMMDAVNQLTRRRAVTTREPGDSSESDIPCPQH